MRILNQHNRVAIWGFGKEGKAAYAFLRAARPDLFITILTDDSPASSDGMPPGARMIGGRDVSAALIGGEFDLVVKSPGVSLYRDEIAKSKQAGVAFTSTTNLWFDQNSGAKIIVVTGTKGKTTTASLLHFMLQQRGFDTTLLGNVGKPALGQAPGRDYTILELSSYQIADLQYGPHIAVVTSLFPEHAPWHGSVEQYYADKLRILSLDAETIAICNHANANLRDHARRHGVIRWYNDHKNGFRVQDGTLMFGDAIVEVEGFQLKGDHNLSNLAGACAVVETLGETSVCSSVNLSGFTPLPHRLEEHQLDNGVLCVDDSISTTPESTLAALEVYANDEIILFLGGAERGQDYTQFLNKLEHFNIRCLILLHQNGRRIFEEISATERPPFEIVAPTDLARAVIEARARAKAGTVMLLSPAAPSFGEFKNFEERGELFVQYCTAPV